MDPNSNSKSKSISGWVGELVYGLFFKPIGTDSTHLKSNSPPPSTTTATSPPHPHPHGHTRTYSDPVMGSYMEVPRLAWPWKRRSLGYNIGVRQANLLNRTYLNDPNDIMVQMSELEDDFIISWR